jgi:two-component system, chemotaxis family, CheB/CheR fusion protein
VDVTDPNFEALLLYLKEYRGCDLTGHKRSSLMRRVGRRMGQVGVADYADYLDYLQVHPEEFTGLFDTVLINVTGFYRDPDSWDYLRDDVVPMILASRDSDAQLRIWSTGCATGEEAYTLAMLMAEILGEDAFRRRVKIYATDVDEDALAHARRATYSERDTLSVPPDLRDRYFETSDGRYPIRKDLRRSVIFGRNDLVQDAPISRIDLLVCRNTLMYFNAETQSRILARLHFALSDGGVLFVGRAETLLGHSDLFTPVNLKTRVFRKVARPGPTNNGHLLEAPQQPPRSKPLGLGRLRNEAFMASPVAQVVITADGLTALFNRQAETLFGVSTRDVGRPFRDLDLSYRPIELRDYIDQARVGRRPTRLTDIEFVRAPGDVLHLEVQVKPLPDADGALLGIALIFSDVTAARRLHDELEHAHRQLEDAYEELQSTNEELETTNDELQSTVEELETTNEELQSTNEELETMNGELQSTNDELQSINDELRHRWADLDHANAFLEAILTRRRVGVAVIDQDMRVQVWNQRAEDLWGLRQEEAIGQHLLNLDIGLPTDQLRPLIRKVVNGDKERQAAWLKAVNRRGRGIEVFVGRTPLTGDGKRTTGVILAMEPTESAVPTAAPGPISDDGSE